MWCKDKVEDARGIELREETLINYCFDKNPYTMQDKMLAVTRGKVSIFKKRREL